MKKNLLALAGAAVALALTSCYYDPYYGSGGSTSVGGSYSSGYGDGYGYGGSSFSTSIFVSTGNPRWGYDPHCYSYYDYHSRRYYDPYLNGYYPIGYRPPVVYGVPHPHGWRPGRGYCPPPSRITNVTVHNYRNRESAYRGTSYGWAKQVRQQSPSAGRPQGSRPAQSSYQSQRPTQQNNASRPARAYSRDSQNKNQGSRPSVRPNSSYNKPVSTARPQNRQQGQRPQPQQQRPNRNDKKSEEDGKRQRGYR
jgi:hypothetical protein